MPRPPRWTPEQLATIKRHWNRQTPERILALVNKRGPTRTLRAMHVKANKLQLGDRDPPRTARLVEVHARACGTHYGASPTVIRDAKRDGVLTQLHHVRGRPYIVPQWWADQYLDRLLNDSDTVNDSTDWYTSTELANALGMTNKRLNSIKHYNHRDPLGIALQSARTRRAMHECGRPVYWHPEDAQAIIRRFGVIRKAA